MSVPAQRRTSSSAKRRRSHNSLKKTNLINCSKCQKPVKPHQACSFCGTYKGKEVLKIKDKKAKKTK